MEESLQVTWLRKTSVAKVVHSVASKNHIIQVAFNNLVVASEKQVDGRPFPVQLGRLVAQAMYLPPECEMAGWSVGQIDAVRLELHPSATRAISSETRCRPKASVRPATNLDDPVLWHLACALKADVRLGRPGGALLRDSIAHHLASHFAGIPVRTSQDGCASSSALVPARLRSVVDYVQAHLHAPIRLADLAAVARLSPFHFSRAFKSVTGKSPYQYVLEQRLVTAARLLEATALTTAEVAATTGFETMAGFAASFRRRWGVPPGAYRRLTGCC